MLEIDRLSWLTIDGKQAFRGTLGGLRRLIVGNDKPSLIAVAERMSRGEM